jgi:MFS family permease
VRAGFEWMPSSGTIGSRQSRGMTDSASASPSAPVPGSARPVPAPPRGGRLAATGGGARLGHGAGFWVIAFAFAAAMAFSTVPTPLYVLYARRDGFGSFTITVVFAAYVGGVLASLFLAGHVSDWIGRRRVIVAALLVEVVAGFVFLGWQSLAPLIVARVLTGAGVGMVTATATAYLGELHAAARPGAGRLRPELVGTAANIGGLGLGPLVAGALAQWAPGPLHTPYAVLVAVLLPAAGAAALVPETVPVARRRYRPQRVSVPAASRGTYLAAIAAAGVVFAVFGLFTSLAPTFVAVTMHHPARIIAGAAAFLVFGAAACTQMALGRMRRPLQLRVGLAVTVAGLAPLTWAVWIPSLALFFAGGAAVGAGGGLLFKGAISTVVELAPPATRGEALAGFFLGAYVGLAVPVLALGTATRSISAETALTWFAAVLGVIALCVAPVVLRRPQRPVPVPEPAPAAAPAE